MEIQFKLFAQVMQIMALLRLMEEYNYTEGVQVELRLVKAFGLNQVLVMKIRDFVFR